MLKKKKKNYNINYFLGTITLSREIIIVVK